MSDKVYLGDSVYAETEHNMVKLTVENGYGATETIYLEIETLDALVRFAVREFGYYLKP